MKKVIITLAVAFCYIASASAQLKIGVEAGMNLSHFKHGGKYQAEEVGNVKAGFQIGGTVDYEFKHHWMLLSGVSFMNTRSNMKLASYSAFHFPDVEIKLNHLMIPLKVGYNFRINEKISLIPSVGVYGMLNFGSGSSSIAYYQYPESGREIQHSHWKPMKGFAYEVITDLPYAYISSVGAFRDFTYGGMAGLKAVVGKHYTLSFDYYEGIMRAQKRNSLRDFGYKISVGYQF